jgi:hypothetical protein
MRTEMASSGAVAKSVFVPDALGDQFVSIKRHPRIRCGFVCHSNSRYKP